MKSSCIEHRAKARIAILREDYLDICDGHAGAAFLLSFFEYWHNIKLEHRNKAVEFNKVAELHGDPPAQDASLYQFHKAEDIQRGLLGAVGEPGLRSGLKILTNKGFISIHRNPNPRYHFDNTKHFLFYPQVVNMAIKLSTTEQLPETGNSIARNWQAVPEKLVDGLPETRTTLSETSSETSSKDTKKAGKVVDGSFEAFYQEYPRHIGKQAALKAWRKLAPSEDLKKDIRAAVRRQKEQAQWQKDDGAFIPHPATWLNGHRWEDEVRISSSTVQIPKEGIIVWPGESRR